jgi:hypothetical protein
MEVDKFTRRMTTDENRALLAELATLPLIQHKLRILIHALWRGQTADKVVSLATTCYVFF